MSSSAGFRGALFVVSAPSGTGKTTVVDRLLEVCPGIGRSRSYTSRPARPAEVDGVDYNFIGRAVFDRMVGQDEFLEWAEVFGHRYGTRRIETERRLAAGEDVVLVIDVQGARQVRRHVPDAVAVFVLPPSFDTLERRLRERSQDSEAAIRHRLEIARVEIQAIDEYDYVVVNDVLDDCVGELAAIVAAERARLERRRPAVEPIVRSFTGATGP
jgi:guanylate kinase